MASDGGDWIGLEIAEGRYKVLGRIGQGSMGSVYLAYDRHLETDVVLKFPGGRDETAAGPEFLDRFGREIRSLVRLSHPHIVKVIDAGELDGHPFVVMQFLAGGSLKDRMMSGPSGEFRPMPPSTLTAGCSRSPRRWTSSTRSTTSTATSSRPTSSSTGTTTHSWAISGSSRPWRATKAGTGEAAR